MSERINNLIQGCYSTNSFPSACRETTLVVYIMTVVGMVVYTLTLNLEHLWVVFVTAGTMG